MLHVEQWVLRSRIEMTGAGAGGSRAGAAGGTALETGWAAWFRSPSRGGTGTVDRNFDADQTALV